MTQQIARIALAGIRCYRRGGIGRYLLELAEQLSEQVEVHVFAASFEDVRSGRIVQHRVPCPRKPYLLQHLVFLRNLHRLLTRERFDLIHTQSSLPAGHDIVTFNTCYGALIESMRRIPGASALDRAKRRWNPLHLLERLQVREGAYRTLICPSEGTRRDLIRLYGVPSECAVVIPEGVDTNEFHPSLRKAHRAQTRKEIGIASEAPLLLFVGYEMDRKGLALALDAFSLLKGIDIRLLVVGDNPDLPRYRRRAVELGIEAHVLFLGGVGDPEFYRRLLAASDALLLPSYYESRSLVVLEAMATGLPVLGTRINGMEEDIADGENGLFVAWDADDIADKMRRLFADPLRLSAMGAAARRHAERFSWKRMAQETLSLYRSVLADR